MTRWCFFLLASCTVADRTDTGPVIHIDLEGDIDNATDQDTSPALFLLSGHTSYSIDVSVTTSAGTSTGDTTSYSPVSTFTSTFAVGTTSLPDSRDMYTDDGYSDPTFKRTAPLLIPASSKGQKLNVHVEAADDRGLASNVIDFAVSLN